MSGPWQDAAVAEEGASYAIHLDGKPIRTPQKRPLQVPTRALADAIVAEWKAQGDKVMPDTMPLTRYMNSVIDTVSFNRESVVDTIAAYAETDLLCYRAERPETLVLRQSTAWDGPLTDLAQRHAAPMIVTTGILPVEQPAESLVNLRRIVEAHDDVALAALHDLTAISGSLVLALALSEERMTVQETWSASRIDEDWQIEQWGEDDLASADASRKLNAFKTAARFLSLSRAVNYTC